MSLSLLPNAQQLELADRFLQHLRPCRSQHRTYWLDVGRVLHSTVDGRESGLRRWIQLTDQTKTFSEEECRQLYPMLANNALTIKTLAWYCKDDAPDDYTKWHQEWIISAMLNATSALDTDVATAVYRIYWLTRVCSSTNPNEWYVYDNKWTLHPETDVVAHMVTGLIRRYEFLRSELLKRKDETLSKSIATLLKKLKTSAYKLQLTKSLREVFYHEKFTKYLNQLPLIGLDNGVVEGSQDQVETVRPYKPEDYISNGINVIYREDLTWEHPSVQAVQHHLETLFSTKWHVFLHLCTCYFKSISLSRLPVLWIDSESSKDWLLWLIRLSFGTYVHSIPGSWLGSSRKTLQAPSGIRLGLVCLDEEVTMSSDKILDLKNNTSPLSSKLLILTDHPVYLKPSQPEGQAFCRVLPVLSGVLPQNVEDGEALVWMMINTLPDPFLVETETCDLWELTDD